VRLDRFAIGSRAAAAVIAAGAIAGLLAVTVEGTGTPSGSGQVWAHASATTPRDAPGEVGRLSVDLTVRGVVTANGDPDAETRIRGSQDPFDGTRSTDSPTPLNRAYPQTLTILAIYLTVGLLLAAATIALFPRRLQPLWPFAGAGALALLVTGVLMRHLTVGALGSWLASQGVGIDGARVHATTASGIPIVGAAIALAGAVAGAVVAGWTTTRPEGESES